MKNFSLLYAIMLLTEGSTMAQDEIILSFSAANGSTPVTLEQVWIRNVTKQCDTLLPPEAASMNLGPAGMSENDPNGSQQLWLRAAPNPVSGGYTDITVHMPAKGMVTIQVTGTNGQVCLSYGCHLDGGNHLFRFYPGKASLYLLRFSSGSMTASLKLISMKDNITNCRLDLIETDKGDHNLLKTTANRGFVFSPGDELLLSCQSGDERSGMILTPTSSQQVIFQFASGVPCPLLETVTYEGKVYNTIQIFGQCWIKENLDIGDKINASQDQSDNGVIEKYCFHDDPVNCQQYGGLYQWGEMMQYSQDEGNHRGICPGDWHLPTDMEWMILEGSIDSHYGIGDPFWYQDGYRGFDAGKKLKANQGYENNGNGTNQYGFSGLPGGTYYHDQTAFVGLGRYAIFWTGTHSASVFAANKRFFTYLDDRVYKDDENKNVANPVRCIKD